METAWLIGEGSTRRKPHIQRGVEQGPAHPDAPLTDTERWLQNTGHEFAKRIHQAEPNPDHIYRGMAVPPEWIEKARQDGSITLPLSSFSPYAFMAHDYSRPDPDRGWAARKGHGVILKVEPGSKSHPINYDENVSHGDFDVLGMHQLTDDESVNEYEEEPDGIPRTVIHVRQRSVPAPVNPTHTASTDGIRYAAGNKPNDWEDPIKGGPQTLYRGLVVPSPVDLEGLARSVGRNWTTDEDRAGFFSDPFEYEGVPSTDTHNYRGGEGPFVGVHLEGEWDGDPDSVDHDWQRVHYDEDEVRLKPGTPVNVTRMHYVYPDHGWDDENALVDGPKKFHASIDGIRYAHIVDADVAEDLMRLAGVMPGPGDVHLPVEELWSYRQGEVDPANPYDGPPPQRGASRLAAVNQDLVDRLKGEFHAWRRQQPKGSIFGGGIIGGLDHWPNIEKFLKDQYPAAHRGLDMGYEEARTLLDHGRMYPQGHPLADSVQGYETGPEAEAKHGYDPKEIAAGMLLLHNKTDRFRGDLSQEDQARLNDIAQKRYQMQRTYEQRNARRRTAAEDPHSLVERLRGLNHRHMLHRSSRPLPDAVIAKHPPLSVKEEAERARLTKLDIGLNDKWNEMQPMTEQELALHKAFRPDAHRHDDLDALTDQQKARHYADLHRLPEVAYGRMPREQHQYDQLHDWAQGYFGNMQNDAQDALERWDDYHQTGLHPTGIESLEGLSDAHHPDLTSAWGAEMTRVTSDRTPVRDKIPTGQYVLLADAAHRHRAALEEMAEHGPLHHDPTRRKSYAFEHVEDTRNKLRVELQHKQVFAVPHIGQLSRIQNPGEVHDANGVVNPRYGRGMTPGGYQDYADQRAYNINCQRCVLASEARHRGYNVEAQRNYRKSDIFSHPDDDTQFPDHSIAHWFSGDTGKTPRWQDVEDLPDPAWQPEDLSDLTDKQREQYLRGTGGVQKPTTLASNPGPHHWDHMTSQIAAWGPGARGIVAVTYKSLGGDTKRHVLKAHVGPDGKVNYYDPQTDEHDQGSHWRDKVDYAGSNDNHRESRNLGAQNWDKQFGSQVINKHYSPLRYLRVDDKELHPGAAYHMVDRGTAVGEPLLPDAIS